MIRDVPGVPRGDVGDGESLGIGAAGDGGGLPCGRMRCFCRAVRPVVGERGVVNEQVGVLGGVNGLLRGAGVPGVDESAAGAGVADDLFGENDGAVLQLDGGAGVELLEFRADGNAQFLGVVAVEAALPFVLDQRVAERVGVVVGSEGADLVVVAPDGDLAGCDFRDVDGERGLMTRRSNERVDGVAGSRAACRS